MHKHKRDYSLIKRDLPEVKDDHVRNSIIGDLEIDRTVFQKDKQERERLKLAKRGIITKRKDTRGGWAWRMRKRLKIEGLDHEAIEKIILSHSSGRASIN